MGLYNTDLDKYFMVFKHFSAKNGLSELSKAEFVQELRREIVENIVYRSAKVDTEEKWGVLEKRQKRVEEHEFCKIPVGFGKLNGICFWPINQNH